MPRFPPRSMLPPPWPRCSVRSRWTGSCSFSALTGFFKPEGQSNYAAGCTFQDALAYRLAQEWTSIDGRPAIKVMNWGYWGHVGVVASRAYRDRTARAGIGSIEPPEAMHALETLLAAPVHQMALWKTMEAGDEPDAFVAVYPAMLPSLAEVVDSVSVEV